MFPRFDEITGKFRFARELSKNDEKRICHPGMFPAYFRYELPQSIFSSVELAALIGRLDAAPTSEARRRVFLEELDSIEKGDPRRTDFLMKLSDAVKSMNQDVGCDLVRAAMAGSDRYVYDHVFVFLAEAGYALRIVIGVAQKLPKQQRVKLLSQCIAEAVDDTMAFRVLVWLTVKKNDIDLGISREHLYPSFAERMRARYGPDVDAWNVDLTTSDKDAFNLWGQSDPTDKLVQYDFWLRYIGQSRSRLASTFQGIFMPVGIYDSDPTPFVENKISTLDLRKLYEGLPDDNELTDSDHKSLRRLKRFLNGDFKNGIGFQQLEDTQEEERTVFEGNSSSGHLE